MRLGALPLVVPFRDHLTDALFGSSIAVQVLLFAAPGSVLLEFGREVASAFRGRATFVSVAPADVRVSSFFGLTDPSSQFPAVRLVASGSAAAPGVVRRYAPPAGVPVDDAASLEAFVRAYFDGTLEPDMRSEEPPTRALDPRRASRRSSGGRRRSIFGRETDAVVLLYALVRPLQEIGADVGASGRTMAAQPSWSQEWTPR